jgi:hypothetical protein
MDQLRLPLFIAALALLLISVSVSSGMQLFPLTPSPDAVASLKAQMIDIGISQGLSPVEATAAAEKATQPASSAGGVQTPPGVGIVSLAFLDGILLYTVAMIGLSMIINAATHARLQGAATLIVFLLVLLGAFLFLMATIQLLMLMLALLLAPPFGTIAYLAGWGGFPKGTAGVSLGLIMTFKLSFAVCLIMAHQRFLKNKSLVILVLLSLGATLLISFLHAIVPGILVSITDAIAAIVVLIVVIIWSLIGLFSSLGAVLKAII